MRRAPFNIANSDFEIDKELARLRIRALIIGRHDRKGSTTIDTVIVFV